MTPSVGRLRRLSDRLAQRLDPVEDRLRDLLLGGERNLVSSPPARRSASPRCSALSKPISGSRDVVEDDQVGALALELLAGALDRLPARARRRSRRSSGPRAGGRRAPARMSSVGSRSQLEAAALARDLARRRALRRGSRPAPRPSAGRGGRRTRPERARRARAAVSTSTRRTPARRGQGDVGGDQGHLGAAPGGARRRGRCPCGRWSGCR